tara:strand:- start:440 stop:814 length:375 start_codon:yes stop_codon:yes gene_type:complete
MAQGNAAATLEKADDWSADFAAATLTVKAGANALVVHTLAGFTTSNSALNALATANAIADETITGAGTQTADSATITAGTKVYTLTVDTAANPLSPAADLRLTTLTYINGETSSINSLVVTFRA